MANITYKTVIAKAIEGFNNIQDKLAELSDLGISKVTVSNGTASGNITPAAIVEALGNVATIKKDNGDGTFTYIAGKVDYKGSATKTVNPTLTNGEVSYTTTLAAGYYTGGIISGSYTLTNGAITATPKVTQKTYDGTTSVIPLTTDTDILLSAPDNNNRYYKVEMVPSVDPKRIDTEGYISDESQIDTTNGVTLTRYIKKGSVSSSAEGGNPVVTPSTEISGGDKITDNFGITTTKPTSGTDGTDYLTVTPKGTPSADSEITAKMTFDSGYIANAGEEGKKIVDATISNDITKYYIPIVNPSFTGGGVSGNINAQLSGTSVTLSPTNNSSGLSITATPSGTVSRGVVEYSSEQHGLINIGNDNKTILEEITGSEITNITPDTQYITKITLGESSNLGYSNESKSEDGVTLKGTTGKDANLYVGFESQYGNVYLRNNGETSYTHVAASGKLTTATPAFDGGEIESSAFLSQSNAVLEDTNNSGIEIVATSDAKSTAVLYKGAVSGWVTKADNIQALAGKTDATTKNSATAYLKAITIAENKTLSSVTINADSTSDTDTNTGVLTTLTNNGVITSYLGSGTISNVGSSSASATLNITKNYGIVNINGGKTTAGGVSVEGNVVIVGEDGKDAGTSVTYSNGNLITTTPTFSGVTISGSASVDNVTGTNIILEDAANNTSGIKFDITASGSAGHDNITYTNTAGWLTANNNTTVINASTSNTALSTGNATKYVKQLTIKDGNSLGSNSEAGIIIGGENKNSEQSKLYVGFDSTNKGQVYIGDTQVVNNGAIITSSVTGPSSNADGSLSYEYNSGWIEEGSITINKGTLSKASKTDAESTTGSYKDHELLTAPILDSEGYLIIGAGYYPNSKISLDTLLGGQSDTNNGQLIPTPTTDLILSGYTAYDVDGKLLVGTMAKWTPSTHTTYYTDNASEGCGKITAKSYVDSTKDVYIRKGKLSASNTAKIDSKYISSITPKDGDKDGTNYFLVTASATAKAEVTSPGWLDTTDNISNVNNTNTDNKDKLYIAASTTTLSGDDTINAPAISINTTDGTNKGVNVGSNLLKAVSQEPNSESEYYVLLDTAADTTGKSITATVTEGYTKGTTTDNPISSKVTLASGSTYFKLTNAAGSSTTTTETINAGSINTVDVASDDGTTTTSGDIYKSLETITTTKPTSKHFLAVKSNESAGRTVNTKTTVTTAGYVPAGDTFTGSGSVKVAAGSTYYIPIKDATNAYSGGGLSKGAASGGGLSGGGLSGGDLSVDKSSITPTVSITLGSDDGTISGVTASTSKPTTGYFIKINAESSGDKATATREAVTRAAVLRAEFKQTVTRGDITNTTTAGYMTQGSHTCSLESSSTSTVTLAALTKDNTSIPEDSSTIAVDTKYVTVNKGNASSFISIPAADVTNGFVTTPGYVQASTSQYKTEYNTVDDCVDIIFN